ncbi:MAG TPA: carbohydrate-binding domain-containing protein, partial [Desulfitobacterium dehalogenans]|nr:carbohydrate-binding domain-containing protein [Desulfitobacterium dehalogenans]
MPQKGMKVMMRKRLRGKILSILLAAALLLTVALPPVTVWAADGDLAVTGTAGGYTYDSGSGVLLFTQNGSYTVSMAPNVSVTTASSIAVASGVTADITLNGVKIDRSSAGGSAFELEETAKVTLTLASGTVNSLTGGKGSVGIGSAGLRVPEGAELTIGGTGELTATGGDSGAGIGGDWKGFSSDCGTITITSGIITAKGG